MGASYLVSSETKPNGRMSGDCVLPIRQVGKAELLLLLTEKSAISPNILHKSRYWSQTQNEKYTLNSKDRQAKTPWRGDPIGKQFFFDKINNQ